MATKPQNDNYSPDSKLQDKRKQARDVHTHGSRRADAPGDMSGQK